ncbi:MAG: hypothetical protein U1E81_19990 [Xanthobacteraceae bacterium]
MGEIDDLGGRRASGREIGRLVLLGDSQRIARAARTPRRSCAPIREVVARKIEAAVRQNVRPHRRPDLAAEGEDEDDDAE